MCVGGLHQGESLTAGQPFECTILEMSPICVSLCDAPPIFDSMSKGSVVSWTASIAAYASRGYNKEAIDLFQQMQVSGFKDNKVTFVIILKLCSNLENLELAKHIHACIVETGVESAVSVGTTLVVLYSKFECIEDARHVFNGINEGNVVSWNAMLNGYARQGFGGQTLSLFEQMLWKGVMPNKFTFISNLKACASLAEGERGKQVHACILESGLDLDIFIESTLVDMYAKCQFIRDACHVFHNMCERNVVSWNSLISGYVQQGLGEEAITLLQQMLFEGVKPTAVTYVSILRACANHKSLLRGKQIHIHILESRCETNFLVESALIDMYTKCGILNEARLVLNQMKKGDVVSWTAMISGYAQQGDGRAALTLFEQMQQEGVKPNDVTLISLLKACNEVAALKNGKDLHALVVQNGFDTNVSMGNTLIDMYLKCGDVESALQVFENMPARDVVSWTVMIGGYAQQYLCEEALNLYELMQQVCTKPDKITFINALQACASLAVLEQGKRIHCHIVEDRCELDSELGSSLVDMYAKCGSMEDAFHVFSKMVAKDTVSWTALIAGYAQQGLGTESLVMFEEMKKAGFKPDEVTFLSVLSACRNAGLVFEGCCHFDSMSRDFGITQTSEHYACMVDLLGRAGHLHEAEKLISKMPSQPKASGWMALLGSCRNHGNTDLGRHAFQSILQLMPDCSGAYLLLLNTYAAAEKGSEGEKKFAECRVEAPRGQSD